TPAPAMNNCPDTPTGTGCNVRSSTYRPVFQIAVPNPGTAVGVSRWQEDHTVVSVGPYRFHTCPTQASNASPTRAGNASPPHHTRSPACPDQPLFTNICQVAGVACTPVAAECSINSANAAGERDTSAPASTTRAPRTSGSHNSNPAMSNPTVVTA